MEGRGDHALSYAATVAEVRQSTGLMSKMRRRLGSGKSAPEKRDTHLENQSRTRELVRKKSNGVFQCVLHAPQAGLPNPSFGNGLVDAAFRLLRYQNTSCRACKCCLGIDDD
jgi:hypothetical protein